MFWASANVTNNTSIHVYLICDRAIVCVPKLLKVTHSCNLKIFHCYKQFSEHSAALKGAF